MTGLVPVPAKGQPMKASWAAAVAERVNALCGMAPSGMLARDGVGGMGAQPLPANLRDRRASAGRPMPFDLKGVVETNPAGTQMRLVVKWFRPGAAVRWNHWDMTPPTLGSSATDAQGWTTVYVGSWKSAQAFSDFATIELWYEVNVTPSWGVGGAPTFTVSGEWSVVDSTQSDHSDAELTTAIATTQTLVSYAVLGTVRGTATGATVTQMFHGALTLHDLLCIGSGGGGGEDATNGTTYPMPFQYQRTDTTDSQGQVVSSSYKIVNNCFYWDGEYHTLADYVPPATGTVYLVATKTVSQDDEVSWSFALNTVEGGSDSLSFRLYDFSSSRIVMDYRTTSLTFGQGPAQPDVDVLTNITFAFSEGTLVATLTKKNLRTLEASTSTVNVFSTSAVSVVTDTDYTNPNFTQQKQTVNVVGTAGSASTENVFTTTPLTAEMTGGSS